MAARGRGKSEEGEEDSERERQAVFYMFRFPICRVLSFGPRMGS